MKKILILLCIALIVAGGVYFYFSQHAQREEIENSLPSGAVAVVKVKDLAQAIDAFKSSQLGQSLGKIDLKEILQEIKIDSKIIARISGLKKQIKSKNIEYAAKTFLGKEAAVAFYPMAGVDVTGQSAVPVVPQFILTTRISPKVSISEFVAKRIEQTGDRIMVENEKYNDAELTIISIPNRPPIIYTLNNGVLTLSFHKEMIYSYLDTVAKRSPSLREDKEFQSTLHRLPAQRKMFVYVDLKTVLEHIDRFSQLLVENNLTQSASEKDISYAVNRLKGLKSLAFAAGTSNARITGKTVLTFDRKQLSKELERGYQCRAKPNATLNFIPKDVIGYQWNCCFDASQAYQSFLARAQQRIATSSDQEKSEERLANFQKRLHLKEGGGILPLLGHEIGGFLNDVNLSGLFPIPESVFFIKITDPTLFDVKLEALAGSGKVLLQTGEYRNTLIHFYALPFGDLLQPSFCFIDNYFLIGTSQNVLKKAIDAAHDPKKALASSRTYNNLNTGRATIENGVFYLKSDIFLKKIRMINSWVLNWINTKLDQKKEHEQVVEKQLQKMKMQMRNLEDGMSIKEDQLQALQSEVLTLQKKGEPAEEKQNLLDALEKEVNGMHQRYDKIRVGQNEMRQQLSAANQDKNVLSLESVKIIMRKGVMPILLGLEPARAILMRGILQDDAFEATSVIWWEEPER